MGTRELRKSHGGDFLTQKVVVRRPRNKGAVGRKRKPLHTEEPAFVEAEGRWARVQPSRRRDVGPKQRGVIHFTTGLHQDTRHIHLDLSSFMNCSFLMAKLAPATSLL